MSVLIVVCTPRVNCEKFQCRPTDLSRVARLILIEALAFVDKEMVTPNRCQLLSHQGRLRFQMNSDSVRNLCLQVSEVLMLSQDSD